MSNSITISVPDAFDSYEEAVVGQIQNVLNTRRAALSDQPAMTALKAANDAGYAAWQHAVQILSGDPNNAQFELAEIQARLAYTVAYNTYQTAFANSGAVALARSAAFKSLQNALPGLMVNPGAVEAV